MTIIINKNKYMNESLAKMAQIIKKRLPQFKKSKNNRVIYVNIARIAQLRKRNVVSLIPKPKTPKIDRRFMTKESIIAVYAILFSMAFAQPVFASHFIIREEPNRYNSGTVNYPTANVFVITHRTRKDIQMCGDGIGPVVTNSASPENCSLQTVHFQLGSAGMTSIEKQHVLDELQRCRVSQTVPLRVTGYTCSLGTEQGNRILSLHRAWEVATVLRTHGYTVKEVDIQGRGEKNPLTNVQEIFAINRRVEIAR